MGSISTKVNTLLIIVKTCSSPGWSLALGLPVNWRGVVDLDTSQRGFKVFQQKRPRTRERCMPANQHIINSSATVLGHENLCSGA